MSSDASQSAPGNAPALPRHVAIIMDGNGRWAKKRLLNRIQGHEKGADTVRAIVRASRERGIAMLTLYAFSTENWQRPAAEINALMNLLRTFLRNEEAELVANNIRLGVIGQAHRLPADVQQIIAQVRTSTANNGGLRLNLALSYGSRAEITEAVRALAAKAAAGTIRTEAIDETVLADHLYTRGMPDPDLLIRTSGEMRVSNFLLWQIAYAEIFVTPTLWPDFTPEEFDQILKAYAQRERRYGGVGDR